MGANEKPVDENIAPGAFINATVGRKKLRGKRLYSAWSISGIQIIAKENRDISGTMLPLLEELFEVCSWTSESEKMADLRRFRDAIVELVRKESQS